MMGKLVTEDEGQSKPVKPQVYQPNRGRNQNRGNYCGKFRNNNAYRGPPLTDTEDDTMMITPKQTRDGLNL